MKILSLLIVIFILLQFTSLAQSGWVEQTSGTTYDLYSVYFINSNKGWAVGDGGTIKHTTDGGENWDSQNNVPADCEKVQFVDVNNGWIVGRGKLFKTTDGGENWDDISDTLHTTSAHFVDGNNGWRTGWYTYGYIFKTTDGGMTWSEQFCETQTSSSFYNIQFISSNIGWAMWQQGQILSDPKLFRTSNGGEDWDDLGETAIHSYCFIDGANGWSTYNANGSLVYIDIKYTADGGNSWQQQFIEIFFPIPSLNTINFVNINSGWAAGNKGIFYNNEWIMIGRILHTSNSGADWTEQECGMVPEINSIYFADENNGWAVGDDGLILHTTTGGVVSVEDEQIEVEPATYYLSNNFPDPFNPSTRIRYSVPQSSNVVIRVFDILGNEIETLVNEEKQIGTYEITWYAKDLPSGVYFYRIQAGSFIVTKKMVLMK